MKNNSLIVLISVLIVFMAAGCSQPGKAGTPASVSPISSNQQTALGPTTTSSTVSETNIDRNISKSQRQTKKDEITIYSVPDSILIGSIGSIPYYSQGSVTY